MNDYDGKQLSKNDEMPFGKHRGVKIIDILTNDAGYLMWLRDKRMEEDRLAGHPHWKNNLYGFSEWVNLALDALIKSKKPFAKFTLWRTEEEKIVVREKPKVEEVPPAPVEALAGWGAF